MQKIETHAHTSHVSPCGQMTPKELVDSYVAAGFDVLTVTEHFNDYVLEAFDAVNPIKAVERYLEGYKLCASYAEEQGLPIKVFLGVESNLLAYGNDFLFFGVEEDFLFECPKLYSLSPAEAHREIEQYGGMIYQAHPFRDNRCTPVDPECLHGIEVFNAHFGHENYNEKALAFALLHGLRQSAGSDCHEPKYVGKAGILVPDEISTEKDLCRYMKETQPHLLDFTGGK